MSRLVIKRIVLRAAADLGAGATWDSAVVPVRGATHIWIFLRATNNNALSNSSMIRMSCEDGTTFNNASTPAVTNGYMGGSASQINVALNAGGIIYACRASDPIGLGDSNNPMILARYASLRLVGGAGITTGLEAVMFVAYAYGEPTMLDGSEAAGINR